MTSPHNIRLLLADVDGTLLTPSKVLTEAAVSSVRDLRQAGIMFAITSGRPPRGMKMLIEPLALEHPSAGFNGGVMFNPDMSVIACHTLDPATAKGALDLILGRGLDAWLYTAEEWLIRDPEAPHVMRETSNVKFDATIVSSFTPECLMRVVKIVGISDDLDLVASCEKAAQVALGERVSAERSQSYYLDVTHPQANKGAVVTALSRLLEVPPAQIATIGDMPNDIAMFRQSGLSIAMGGASDEVKAQADVATDHSDHEGFANAVQRFVL